MLYAIVIDGKFDGTSDAERPIRALDAADKLIPEHAQKCERVGTAVWMVQSTEGADTWAARLRPHIGTNDRLIVAPIEGVVAGLLPGAIWPWINEQSVRSSPRG